VDVYNDKIQLYHTSSPKKNLSENGSDRLSGIEKIILYKYEKKNDKGNKMKDANAYYYIDPERGYMTGSKLVTYGNHLYYVYHSGRVLTDKRKKIKVGKVKYMYCFDKNGRAVKNRSVKYEGKTYYYNKDGRELKKKNGKVKTYK
jgi:hypothetical protein